MLPKHIAVIMDGNGRWAKTRGMPRSYGHQKGAEVMEGLCNYAFERGIKCVSFYAFSTENWSRPEDEVKKLMALMKKMLKKFLPKFVKRGIRLVVSGDLTSDKISDESKALIADAVERTKDLKEGTINICFNYGSKSEIVHAANAAIKSGQPVTEQTISENLWTKGLPDVDLLIRPGGELRLSNFLLWQSAYAELYFIDCLWPDFTNEELDKALQWYEGRNRRFGNV